MSFKDYYNILGLNSNKVTLDEIKLAYREKAKKYHPDINAGDTSSEEKFKEINEAYKVLSDSKSRKRYDRSWFTYTERKKRIQNKEREVKKSFKEKLIDILFGMNLPKKEVEKKEKDPIIGENIETEVEVNVLEAFNGTSKKLKLLAIDGKTKTFNLNIPAGVQDGDKIRFVGQGKMGKNNGKRGDLLVKIKIIDTKDLKLVGADIYKEVSITPWQAALGTKLKIDAIDGEISLVIPKGTESGEKFTIKDRGYKFGRGNRGNFIIVTRIVVPKELTEKQEKIYNELKALDAKIG